MTKITPPQNLIANKAAESNATYFYVLPINTINEVFIAGMTPTTFISTRVLSWVLTNAIIPGVMWHRKRYHKKKEITEDTLEKEIRKTDRLYATKLVAISRPLLIGSGLLVKQYLINKGWLNQDSITWEEGIKNIVIGTAGGVTIVYNIGGQLFKFADLSKELLHLKPLHRLKESLYNLPKSARRSIATGYIAANIAASVILLSGNQYFHIHDRIEHIIKNSKNWMIEQVEQPRHNTKEETKYTMKTKNTCMPSESTWNLYVKH